MSSVLMRNEAGAKTRWCNRPGAMIGLLIVLVTAPAQATETPLPILTFEEAVASARQNNPDLKVAQARLEAARQSVLKAWSAYLPRADASGSWTHNSTEAVLPFPNFEAGFDITTTPAGDMTAIPREFTNVEVQKRNQYGAQFSASQPLLFVAAIPGILGAYTAEEIAALTTEQAKREILFATAELYLNAVGLREAVRLAAVQVELLGGHLHNAEMAFAAGTVMELAVLRARMDLGQAEQDQVRATNAYAAIRSSLAALIGREDTHYDVASVDIETMAGESAPIGNRVETETQLGTALRQRPDMQAASLGIEASHRARQAVWAQFLPVVSANWTWRYSDVKGFTGDNTVWALMFTASVPLLTGGLRYAQLREAEANIVQADAQAESVRAKIEDQVRRARLDVASARANRRKAHEQVDLARRNWRAVEKAFEVGASSPTDVADAAAALKAAELGLVRETIGVWVADIHLDKALGVAQPAPVSNGLQYARLRMTSNH